MLVLSRRPDQQICFPNLGVTLKVLQIRGTIAKIGIDAPADVAIVRPDASSDNPVCDKIRERMSASSWFDQHQFRNHLNAIRLGVELCHKQLEFCRTAAVEQTLQTVVDELAQLDRAVAAPLPQPARQAQRLLVVDDDVNERELLAEILRLHGFAVEVCGDGFEAPDVLAHSRGFDALLLDMSMPNCDGPTTISRIRSDAKLADLQIFAVSGTSPHELGVDESSYRAWIPKPLDSQRLLQAVGSQSACSVVTA